MICWQTVKEFFGAEKKPKVVQPLTEGKTKAAVKPQPTTRRPPPPRGADSSSYDSGSSNCDSCGGDYD